MKRELKPDIHYINEEELILVEVVVCFEDKIEKQ